MRISGPVGGEADFVSVFMSLPKVLQSSLIMAVLAVQELPDDQAAQAQAVLAAVEEQAGIIGEEGAHFLSMCSNIAAASQIARFANPREL